MFQDRSSRRYSTPSTTRSLSTDAMACRRPAHHVQFNDDMGLEEIPETYFTKSTAFGNTARKTDLVRFLSQDSINQVNPNIKRAKVHLKAIFMLPTLSPHRSNAEGGRLQEDLLKACEAGNSKAVEELLASDVEYNVNCTDFLGRTPLQIAVEKEDLLMIELLVPKSSIGNIESTLLHAINESKESIACNIIRHERYAERIHPLMKRLGTQRGVLNTDFTATSGFYLDTTPLILASQRELYTVVKLLLLQGSQITQPHAHDCPCRVCEDRYKTDYMRYAHRRLNAYKGLTSTSYITLGSNDPFAEVFRLKKEVLKLAAAEKYFKAEYMNLARKLSTFLVKLTDNIRGTIELDLILKRVDGDRDKFFEPMARFRFAVSCKEKQFVAHPSCQMKLNCLWFSHARFLQRANWARLIGIFCVFVILYPPFVIFYNFFPWIKKLSILDSPAMKFMAHAYSFFMFITFLFARSFAFTSGNEESLYHCLFHEHMSTKWFKFATTSSIVTRNLHFSVWDSLITVWVLGMLWNKCRKIYKVGATEHVMRYNIYEAVDTALIFFYITSIALELTVIYKATEAVEFFKRNCNATHEFFHGQDSMNTSVYHHWYFLNDDRFYWQSFDPKLMSEIMFAIANILSIARVSYILAANEMLGPLQISLGRMTADILRFVVLFAVLFTAFMVGLDNLLWPFFIDHREKTELIDHRTDDETMQAGDNFGFFLTTFRSMFWLTFGLAEYEMINMMPFDLIITQNAAYILLGAHIFCIVIVMLNMLIAMMSRSYEQIEQEADTEFKFARSQLYLEYIDENSPLPVPLNLIPNARDIKRGITYLINNREQKATDREIEENVEEDTTSSVSGTLGKGRRQKQLYRELEKINYYKTIKTIVQRFISDVTKNNDDESDNNVDVVRQDILRMRTELQSNIDDQNAQEGKMADSLTEVKSAIEDVRKQQDEILQQFRDCVTKLNTFENMVSSIRRRDRMFTAQQNAPVDGVEEEVVTAETASGVTQTSPASSNVGEVKSDAHDCSIS